ncbi:MAG: hypothetical protein U9Q05_06235, partial [Thermodesulfobacteriota bacterium]|nr:hypothetical protein [Thermodesulfobacteriota bacterium]
MKKFETRFSQVDVLPMVKHYMDQLDLFNDDRLARSLSALFDADRIGLVPTINRLVDSEMDIDPGTVFLGMVLDTLSGRSPLYR